MATWEVREELGLAVGQRGWEQVELGLVKGAGGLSLPTGGKQEAPRPGPLELGRVLDPLGHHVLTTSLGSLRQWEAEEGLGDGPHRLHTARVHSSWEP